MKCLTFNISDGVSLSVMVAVSPYHWLCCLLTDIPRTQGLVLLGAEHVVWLLTYIRYVNLFIELYLVYC